MAFWCTCSCTWASTRSSSGGISHNQLKKSQVSYSFRREHSCDLYRRGDLLQMYTKLRIFYSRNAYICTNVRLRNAYNALVSNARGINCHARKNGRVSLFWLSNTVCTPFVSVEKCLASLMISCKNTQINATVRQCPQAQVEPPGRFL
jgi:hypothetical protein